MTSSFPPVGGGLVWRRPRGTGQLIDRGCPPSWGWWCGC